MKTICFHPFPGSLSLPASQPTESSSGGNYTILICNFYTCASSLQLTPTERDSKSRGTKFTITIFPCEDPYWRSSEEWTEILNP